MEYGYRFGYTSAQIDLMVADQPVIDYGKTKKRGSMMANKSEVDELDALTSAWEKKRNGRSFVGQTVDLNDFLQQKV